jgi:hypothetical protein
MPMLMMLCSSFSDSNTRGVTKTMVNQVRNLGSTKCDDHEMVKVIIRSLIFRILLKFN